jgi:hypothetical protein
MIENYFKTFDGSEGRIVPFMLFPRQKEFLNNMVEHQGNITLKPRQTGYSTVSCAKIAAEMVLAPPDSPITVLVIAQNFDKSKDNAALVKQFIKQTPLWFFGKDLMSDDPEEEKRAWKKIIKSESKTEIQLANGSKMYARSSSPTASNGIPSVSILFVDEAALFQDGAAVFAEAVRTTSTIKDKLIIMVSTPNGRDDLYYEYYQGALAGTNGYKVTETRWYDDPRYNKNLRFYKDKVTAKANGDEVRKREWITIPTIDKKGNVRWDPEYWKKLEGEGWKATSPWYVQACKENNNDRQTIAQSLECSFIGSDSIAVDPEIIDMHRKLNVNDDYKTDPLCPEFRIWKPPLEGHRYFIGCDGSRGDADDSSTLEIIDIDAEDEKGNKCIEQVAEYVGKMAMDLIGELAMKYGTIYNNALAIFDGIGGYCDAAGLKLLRGGYPNLFYDTASGKDYLSLDMKNTTFHADNTGKIPGFHTRSARAYMIENFINSLRENMIKIRSSRVIGELETWIVTATGKVEHKRGKHDDTLTNLAMTLFIYDNHFTKIKRQGELNKTMLSAWVSSLKVNERSEEIPATTDKTYPHLMRNGQFFKKKYTPSIYSTKTMGGKGLPDYGWLFPKY